MRTRWTRLVELLGVNSVPVVGVLAGEWSSATALTVYWIENLVASVLTAGRLALHARWRDPSADPDVAAESSFACRRPGPFLATTVPFSIAHGLMLVAVFALVLNVAPDAGHLRQAAVALVVMQGLAFGVDLWTLADWPVARVNERADHLTGRVVMVHLAILIGMVAFAWLHRPGAFFAFFVGCKLLADATALLPRVDPGTPDRPPRWLAAIMRHVPRQNGETFEEYWRRTHRSGDRGPGTGGRRGATAPPRPKWRGRRMR